MSVLFLGETDTLEINDILKNRFFLRFLNKYQQRYNDGKRREYKKFPREYKSAFSDEFYSDLEDIFGDISELKTFFSEFREEMICHPHIWEKINSECDDDEFILGILSLLKIHFSLCKGDQIIKDICQEKVREILKQGNKEINEFNDCSLVESIQIGRENNLFPFDSLGDFIIFISGRGNEFVVSRKISGEVTTVMRNGKIIGRKRNKMNILGEGESREYLLLRKEQLKLFLDIYNAISGNIENEVVFKAEDFEAFGEFVDIWVNSLENFESVPGQELFQQEDSRWGIIFKEFLEKNISILERKTHRVDLHVVK